MPNIQVHSRLPWSDKPQAAWCLKAWKYRNNRNTALSLISRVSHALYADFLIIPYYPMLYMRISLLSSIIPCLYAHFLIIPYHSMLYNNILCTLPYCPVLFHALYAHFLIIQCYFMLYMHIFLLSSVIPCFNIHIPAGGGVVLASSGSTGAPTLIARRPTSFYHRVAWTNATLPFVRTITIIRKFSTELLLQIVTPPKQNACVLMHFWPHTSQWFEGADGL